MWFVYYLHDALTGDLLYIGRSHRPKRRQNDFHALHHVLTEMGPTQRHKTFEAACRAELAAIAKHQPPFNQKLQSSRGFLGHKHSIETLFHISTKVSKPKSEATKAAMRKPKSEQHKANMRKPKSPEHAAKLVAVLKRAQRSKRG